MQVISEHDTSFGQNQPPPEPGESVLFRLFRPGDEAAFRDLNVVWIQGYFRMEPKDFEVLDHPVELILEPGGHIIMAEVAGVAMGCCALLPMGDDSFEVAKMTVSDKHRGSGIGRKLLSHVIEHAKAIGAKRLYLETNHILVHAIGIYEALGFTHVPKEQLKPSPYARADVYMEMMLG